MTDGIRARSAPLWVLLALGFSAFVVGQHYLGQHVRGVVGPELKTTLPLPAQILFAAGDRRLAANFLGFRVLVADVGRMSRDDYAVQARLQRDLSWLSPAHEDNYYIAANILPWGDEIDAAEEVLRRAAIARPRDWLPLFHVGFIHYHFRHQPANGAKWLIEAAERAHDQQDKWGLQNIAAKWIELGYELTTAAELVGAMANNAPPGGFKTYLQMRSQRLAILADLRAAAVRFQRERGRPASSIKELEREKYIARVPKDPLGIGFRVTDAGEIQFEKN